MNMCAAVAATVRRIFFVSSLPNDGARLLHFASLFFSSLLCVCLDVCRWLVARWRYEILHLTYLVDSHKKIIQFILRRLVVRVRANMSSARTGFTRQICVAQVNRSDCAWMRVCDSKIDLLNIENRKKSIGDITLGPVACAPGARVCLATEANRSRCTHAIYILGAGTISFGGFSLNDMSHGCRWLHANKCVRFNTRGNGCHRSQLTLPICNGPSFVSFHIISKRNEFERRETETMNKQIKKNQREKRNEYTRQNKWINFID